MEQFLEESSLKCLKEYLDEFMKQNMEKHLGRVAERILEGISKAILGWISEIIIGGTPSNPLEKFLGQPQKDRQNKSCE